MFDSLRACSSRSTLRIGWSSSCRLGGAGCCGRRGPRAVRARAGARCLARSLLEDVVAGDARLAWLGARVGLADPPHADVLIEDAEFVVFDLETTGLSASRCRICEIGAARVRALAIEDTFETLVNPARPSRPDRRADRDPGQRPAASAALRAGGPSLSRFRWDAPLAAHNARSTSPSSNARWSGSTGRRVAAPVVDTVWLARRLLQRRSERFSLASLAHFFGTSTSPCHRALPDAVATAEILVSLLGLAQERGARPSPRFSSSPPHERASSTRSAR